MCLEARNPRHVHERNLRHIVFRQLEFRRLGSDRNQKNLDTFQSAYQPRVFIPLSVAKPHVVPPNVRCKSKRRFGASYCGGIECILYLNDRIYNITHNALKQHH